MIRTISILCAVTLAGCSIAPPGPGIAVQASTPASITIWAKSRAPLMGGQQAVPDSEVTRWAQNHCTQYGKNARRAFQETNENDRTITFDCV